MKMYQKTFKSALLASCAVMVPELVNAQEQDAQYADQTNVDTVVAVGRYIPDEKRSTSEISNVVTASDLSFAGDSDVAAGANAIPNNIP